ncbi:hypothetical protein BST22_06505 [Mycolicibacterium chubuense]|uniref:Dibenzothiophene desulfurization enzyme C n=1 Tax=Mycolicibacterium chubuense TaxID=1800 RepID=A0A0J6W7R9_MYCCU|nr:acyl-CoA dehydrogenase family protein [Mycolicibacterium chubuense]KMO77677.1 Dibenzothiophene desulfurization enzyme C [Mycolicibacterium chubuense]ORA54269.1 hypothetical protein BST22_06505 [Mycolicibacterium chubuense]SPX96760.1 acyl-CoA dehydrogenase type 2 [Mycolicibacterium chubuense]
MTVLAPSWLEAAHSVRESLKSDAAQRDRSGAAPRAEVELLRDAGLLGIFVPREHGGGGASWSEVAAVIGAVAQADSSVAHVLLYHYFGSLAGTRGENGFVGPERARRIAEGRLFNGTVAQAAYPPLITATQTPQGFRLTGTKPFTSGAALADVLVVWAAFDEGTVLLGNDVAGQLATFHVDAAAPGVSFGGDWDNVGQRLTVSGTTTLTHVEARTGDIIGYGYGVEESSAADHLDVLHMYAGFATIFTGIAVGALEEAADYTRARSRAWVESPHSRATEDPLVRERYGRLWTQVQSAIALTDRANAALDAVREAGDDLSWAHRADAVTLINAARVHASEVALEVSSRLFEVTGARSSAAATGLDRFWRNARTLSLHDPLPHKQVQIGAYVLDGVEPSPGFYS